VAAELKKQQKCHEISAGMDFIPFAIETSGVWGEWTTEYILEIGRRLAEVSHDLRSTALPTSTTLSASPAKQRLLYNWVVTG